MGEPRLDWPLERLGEALQATACAAGLAGPLAPLPSPSPGIDQDRWFAEASAKLGLECQAVHALHGELDGMLARVGPALVRLQGEGEPRFLALLGRDWRRRVRLLAPDGSTHHLHPRRVRALLCEALEQRVRPGLEVMLAAARVPEEQRERSLDALVAHTLVADPIGGFQLLRRPVARSFRRSLLAGPGRRLALLIASSCVEYAMLLVAWWLVGRGTLAGRLEPGWLAAWMLALLCLVPLRMTAGWLQGSCAVETGVLLKRRLYEGLTRLRPDEIRHMGVGRLISRVLESEAVEHLGLAGGLGLAVALVELGFGAWVLSQGAGGLSHVLLLAAWLVFTLGLTWRYALRRRGWTERRLEQSHELVQAMLGQRTRAVQQAPERWHDGEDAALADYLEASRGMDRWALGVAALPVRGWTIVGILALAPAVMGVAASPTALAISLGGVLLAGQGLQRVAAGVASLVDAGISWDRVSSLFHAAARPVASGSPLIAPGFQGGPEESRSPLLELRDLHFQHTERSQEVLSGIGLGIERGDRLLLEGPSGGGKSTLVALVSGLRKPTDGLLLLSGLDRASVGAVGWRRAIAVAPQFHENHVFAGTLAFNLLMGRRWPPRSADLAEAEALCIELGLGELLERMPAGLYQLVGESGWQLSHGERSRLFLARALLQGAELVVLDETMAALDPDSLDKALRCVLRRAPTLLVVAHP
jgi:ATP-binding cassette subfamily B protein